MKKSRRNFKKLKFIIFFVFIILAIVLFIFASYLGYTPENIGEKLNNNYYYETIIIFIILIAIAAATTLPITAVMIPGIIFFSFQANIFYTTIGIFIGALFTFFMSRYLGKDYVKDYVKLKGGRVKALNDLIEEKSFKLILLLNLVYFFPSNIAHMVAGLTKTKFNKFLLATVMGNLPNTFAVALVIYGTYWLNSTYVICGVIILIIISIIPLYFYRKHIKELIILAYSQEMYKDLKKAEKLIKKE